MCQSNNVLTPFGARITILAENLAFFLPQFLANYDIFPIFFEFYILTNNFFRFEMIVNAPGHNFKKKSFCKFRLGPSQNWVGRFRLHSARSANPQGTLPTPRSR